MIKLLILRPRLSVQKIFRGIKGCFIMVSWMGDDAGMGELYLFAQHIFFFFLLHHHHHFLLLLLYYYHCCVRSLPLHHGFFGKPSLSRHIKPMHSYQLLMHSSMALTGLQDQEGNSTFTELAICCIVFVKTLGLFENATWTLKVGFERWQHGDEEEVK